MRRIRRHAALLLLVVLGGGGLACAADGGAARLPPVGARYASEIRVITRRQTIAVDVLPRRRLRLELRGLVEGDGYAWMEARPDGDLRVELDEATARRVRALGARVEGARFDALRDVAEVRVRPGWLPAVTLRLPRAAPRGWWAAGGWLSVPAVFL